MGGISSSLSEIKKNNLDQTNNKHDKILSLERLRFFMNTRNAILSRTRKTKIWLRFILRRAHNVNILQITNRKTMKNNSKTNRRKIMSLPIYAHGLKLSSTDTRAAGSIHPVCCESNCFISRERF